MSVISRFALAALYVGTFAGSLPSQVSPSSASQIRVTLLGTAAGPPVRVGAAGISTLVEVGQDRFLFDAGRGLMQRLVQAGVRVNAVDKLFLTHLHSDHVIDVPDLLLMGWSATPARSARSRSGGRRARVT